MEPSTTLQEKRIETERKTLDAAKSVFAALGLAGAKVVRLPGGPGSIRP